MHRRPVLRLLSSPCQLGAAPLGRWDAISPTGELFIHLFNFIILAEWRLRLTMIKYNPPKLMLFVSICVCMLIKRPHTSERGSVCRFIGALDACISPYQRTLIAPSMSEQIHVCTSIHKASLTHTMCPPSLTSLPVVIHNMGLTQTHVYTHFPLYRTGDINNFLF